MPLILPYLWLSIDSKKFVSLSRRFPSRYSQEKEMWRTTFGIEDYWSCYEKTTNTACLVWVCLEDYWNFHIGGLKFITPVFCVELVSGLPRPGHLSYVICELLYRHGSLPCAHSKGRDYRFPLLKKKKKKRTNTAAHRRRKDPRL